MLKTQPVKPVPAPDIHIYTFQRLCTVTGGLRVPLTLVGVPGVIRLDNKWEGFGKVLKGASTPETDPAYPFRCYFGAGGGDGRAPTLPPSPYPST